MPSFTLQQDAALTATSAWLKAARGRASIFRLFGYAGTGKTTLAKHLAEGNFRQFHVGQRLPIPATVHINLYPEGF